MPASSATPRCHPTRPAPPDAPGAKRLTQKVSWHNPGYYLLILAGVLLYAIVAICIQKKATIELSLCREHNAKRVRWLTITWLCVLGGLGLVVAGCAGGSAYAHHNEMWPVWVTLGGLLVALVGGIVGSLKSRALTPQRIDDRFAWLKGASPEFLAGLPTIQ